MNKEKVFKYYRGTGRNSEVDVFEFNTFIFINNKELEAACSYCISNKEAVLKEIKTDGPDYKKYNGKTFDEIYSLFKINEYPKMRVFNKCFLEKVETESYIEHMQEIIDIH